MQNIIAKFIEVVLYIVSHVLDKHVMNIYESYLAELGYWAKVIKDRQKTGVTLYRCGGGQAIGPCFLKEFILSDVLSMVHIKSSYAFDLKVKQ